MGESIGVSAQGGARLGDATGACEAQRTHGLALFREPSVRESSLVRRHQLERASKIPSGIQEVRPLKQVEL